MNREAMTESVFPGCEFEAAFRSKITSDHPARIEQALRQQLTWVKYRTAAVLTEMRKPAKLDTGATLHQRGIGGIMYAEIDSRSLNRTSTARSPNAPSCCGVIYVTHQNIRTGHYTIDGDAVRNDSCFDNDEDGVATTCQHHQYVNNEEGAVTAAEGEAQLVVLDEARGRPGCGGGISNGGPRSALGVNEGPHVDPEFDHQRPVI
ncbi:hypothetical protein ARMGADRAFT_1036234 [Armillaria gallica]|uniref:Uncharacterized protein n=1 Tax=Armillaria gallica TaxID=47427 RepID=A0A2H3CVI9_ARMGA|nr:hypothetical protein ARMGADRAFT_1036234 [Armillaria gallica]